jgi:hypothetical protein
MVAVGLFLDVQEIVVVALSRERSDEGKWDLRDQQQGRGSWATIWQKKAR